MLGMLPKSSLALVIVLSAACFPDAVGVRPDVNTEYFYYPVGLGFTRPNGSYLLVASSNFDLQFNSGTVVALDLEPLADLIGRCREGQTCPDFVVPAGAGDAETEVVDYLLEEHAVLIGSYASSFAVTESSALIPVRSDASLHFIDVEEVPRGELETRRVLRCSLGEGSTRPGPVQVCGANRRVRSGTRLRGNLAVGLPSEPYAVVPWTYVCPAGSACEGEETDYAVVGHMTGGELSLFERVEAVGSLPRDCGDNVDNDGDGLSDVDDPGCQGSTYRLIDVDDSAPEGTTGLAVDNDGRFLATSRFVSDLTATRIGVANADLGLDPAYGAQLSTVKTIDVDAVSPGNNQRGLAFSPTGDRAFVASRAPSSILVLDVSLDENGDNIDRFLDVIEIGNGPSVIRVLADDRFPLGYLVYAVCFEDDRIFIIDPSINEVVDVIATRRGPHEIVFDAELGIAYLINFLESTLSILDVDPDSPRFHTFLTTLGTPRRPRSND